MSTNQEATAGQNQNTQQAAGAAAESFLHSIGATPVGQQAQVVEDANVIIQPSEGVAPEPDEEDRIEVKNTSSFEVRFLKSGDSKKLIPGSKAAVEALIRFAYMRGSAEAVEEEAPKKRGRPSKNATVAEAASGNEVLIEFYDDANNAAADFIDALADREDFAIKMSMVVDGEVVENHLYTECSVKPSPYYVSLVKNELDNPLTLPLVVTYGEYVRESVNSSSGE